MPRQDSFSRDSPSATAPRPSVAHERRRTDAYNLDLSQRRAQSVLAALVKRGVDAGRLKAKGFGRAKPVADNATAQGRALNRRAEVSVID